MKKSVKSFRGKTLLLSLLFRPSVFTLALASVVIAGHFIATIR